MNFLKILLTGAFALSALAFVACGSDSSSNGVSSNGSGDDPTKPVSAKIHVDDIAKTITIVYQESGERCVYKNSSYSWQEKLLESDTSKVYYFFQEDTLILSESKHNSEAVVLVGGNPGELYGTWKTTSKRCTYNIDEEEYDCGAFDKPYYYEYTFGEDEMTYRLVITEKDEEAAALEEALNKYNSTHAFKKYAFSKLTTSIIKGILTGSFDDLSANDAFIPDSSNFEYLIKDNKIEFEPNSQGTAVNLVFKGKKNREYPVTIEYGETEMAADDNSYELIVSVTYGETTETLKSEGSIMTAQLCSDDNEDNFDISKTRDPQSDEKYTYVTSYAKSNIKQFRSRLGDVFENVSDKLLAYEDDK